MKVSIDNLPITIVFIAQIFFILALLLSLIWLIIKLSKWSSHLVVSALGLMAGGPVIKILSASISLYFFPEAISYILFVLYSLFKFFFVEMPTEFLSGMKLVAAQCKASSTTCGWIFSETVYKTWVTLITKLFDSFDQNPVPVFPILCFISLASIFSLLLTRLTQTTNTGVFGIDLAKKIYASIKTLPSYYANLALLLIILAIGAYLSLASIVAIPAVVIDHKIEPVNPNRLNEQLLEAAFRQEQFDTLFPEQILTPMSNIEITKTQNDDVVIMLGSFLQTQIDLRDHLLKDWKQLRGYYFDKQNSMIKEAVARYEIENTGRRGTRERTQHFIDIDSWFRDWRRVTENILNACRAAIWRFDSEGPIRIATTFVSLSKSGKIPEVNQEPIFEMLKSASDIARVARNNCEQVQDLTSIPKRDDFGTYLGPFGAMSFWLLRTESPALVMITGLLGFGLFGAGCSTFIRYRRRHSLSALAGEDIGGVVIRGASAAVVVFLAVYGGLAVFVANTTAPEPNAYAVFFTCLVAAVFSEEAWNWAHKRFPLNRSEGEQKRASRRAAAAAPGRGSGRPPSRRS